MSRLSSVLSMLAMLLLVGVNQSFSASYNDICNTMTHCNASMGLVCDKSGRCKCSSGPLVHGQHSFQLTWDPETQNCVGDHLSGCIGTRLNPVPEGMKQVPCSSLFTCIQLRSMPKGVGTCQNVTKVYYHGTQCDERQYCDASRNLLCIDGACRCAYERGNTWPQYQLVWDEARSTCVASSGAACIGTRLHPVASGQKAILCSLGEECVDAPGATPGVGVCVTEGSSVPGDGNSGVTSGQVSSWAFVLLSSLWVLRSSFCSN